MFKKIVNAIFPSGITVEHEKESFVDIYELYKGQDVKLILERWERNNVGYVFKDAAIIGNCKDYLCHNDYWEAYDKIF